MRSDAAAAINLSKTLGERAFTLLCCSFPNTKSRPNLSQMDVTKKMTELVSAKILWAWKV